MLIKKETECIGAVLIHLFERVDDVALRLRHLLAVGVAHERVDDHFVEWCLTHEVHAHHQHARHPEEDDVEARDER
jgi:hypothetical protein